MARGLWLSHCCAISVSVGLSLQCHQRLHGSGSVAFSLQSCHCLMTGSVSLLCHQRLYGSVGLSLQCHQCLHDSGSVCSAISVVVGLWVSHCNATHVSVTGSLFLTAVPSVSLWVGLCNASNVSMTLGLLYSSFRFALCLCWSDFVNLSLTLCLLCYQNAYYRLCCCCCCCRAVD